MTSEIVLKNAFLNTFRYSLYYIGKAILLKYITLKPATYSFSIAEMTNFDGLLNNGHVTKINLVQAIIQIARESIYTSIL